MDSSFPVEHESCILTAFREHGDAVLMKNRRPMNKRGASSAIIRVQALCPNKPAASNRIGGRFLHGFSMIRATGLTNATFGHNMIIE